MPPAGKSAVTSPAPSLGRVLVVKADWFSAAGLAHALQAVLPHGEIASAHTIASARASLLAPGVDLVLTDIIFTDGDVFDLLPEKGARRPRFFIVTEEPPLGVLERLRKHGVSGVFDSGEEDIAAFHAALGHIAAGQCYYSPGVRQRIVAAGELGRFYSSILTPSEQVVFAAIGDGSDDQEAGEQLGLKPSSVKSVRRELHRKFGFRSNADLVRFAAQYGIVRFTAHGAVRVGFNHLLDGRRAGKRPFPIKIAALPATGLAPALPIAV